jgi:hypothetical protein
MDVEEMADDVIDVEEERRLAKLVAGYERQMISDFPFFAKEVIRIIDKEKRLVPLSLNKIQMIVQEIKADIRKRGMRVRLIIDKARQFGLSTEQLGENYWFASTNLRTTCLFVSHEPKSTVHLFDIVKRMHDKVPVSRLEWKPEKKKSNAYELVFKEIDSAIRVGTAGSDNLGSSQTINRLHLSELSKYPVHTVSSLITSLLQTVPKSDPNSEVVVESTANGVGGEFYEMYWSSRYQYTVYVEQGVVKFRCDINKDADPNNEYCSLFIPWYAHSEYQMDPSVGFTRTPEEIKWVQEFGVTDSQLQWYRHVLANECKNDRSIRKQEYPFTARESFITSGRPVFDNEKIEVKIKTCLPPIAYYDCIPDTGVFTAKAIRPGEDTTGLLQVWEEPKPGVAYVVSADVSEGLEIIKKQTDFSSVDVLEQLTGKQVAHFHGKIEPVQLGILLFHIGKRYNMAWLVPERNNHGTAVCSKLFELHYPNLYHEETPNAPHKPLKRYGWLTTGGKYGQAKAMVIDNMSELINNDADGIQCIDTLKEFLTFKHSSDGKLGAETGCFDDRVLSISIGNFVRKRLQLPSSMRAKQLVGQNISVSAWT